MVRSVLPSSVNGAGTLPGQTAEVAKNAATALMAASTALVTGDVPAASTALGTALEAVQKVAQQTGAERDVLLKRAMAEQQGVVDGEALPIVLGAVPVYDGYFGTLRVREATEAEVLVGIAPTMVKLVAELPSVGLPLDDRAALARLAARMLDPNVETTDVPTVEPNAGITATGNDPLERWKVGHAFYGLACRKACVAVKRATELFAARDFDGATAQLLVATDMAQAFTAAMEFAAAMSMENYSEPVRPSMRPPHLELDLTGFMNLDYSVYRREIDVLVGECNETFRKLAEMSQPMAEARDELLHLDLVDLERHIALTYRLVGHVPALDESQYGSAVQALRASYLRRLRTYSPLLRHGHITEDGFDAA